MISEFSTKNKLCLSLSRATPVQTCVLPSIKPSWSPALYNGIASLIYWSFKLAAPLLRTGRLHWQSLHISQIFYTGIYSTVCFSFRFEMPNKQLKPFPLTLKPWRSEEGKNSGLSISGQEVLRMPGFARPKVNSLCQDGHSWQVRQVFLHNVQKTSSVMNILGKKQYIN